MLLLYGDKFANKSLIKKLFLRREITSEVIPKGWWGTLSAIITCYKYFIPRNYTMNGKLS